jgi:hypothetical protein
MLKLFKPFKPPPLSSRVAGEDEGGGLSGRFMADNFDIVAVGIEDKRAVVIRMILGSQSRRAVVFSSGSEGGLMKGIH